MSEELSKQAADLWQMVSSPKTAETYKNTASITWQILKTTGHTLWLACCWVLVAADWLATTAIALGKKARLWLEALRTGNTQQSPSLTSEEILALSQQSFTKAVAKARQQLGLPEKLTISPTTATPTLEPPAAESPPTQKP